MPVIIQLPVSRFFYLGTELQYSPYQVVAHKAVTGDCFVVNIYDGLVIGCGTAGAWFFENKLQVLEQFLKVTVNN